MTDEQSAQTLPHCAPGRPWRYWIAVLSLGLSGCLELRQPPPQVPEPEPPSTLHVGTLYGPTSYTETGQGMVGFDYDLVRAFAESAGLELTIHPFHRQDDLFSALDKGQIQLMAAGLATTPDRHQRWLFGPPLYQITPQLVYRHGSGRPKNWSDLNGNLVVVTGSTHAEELRRLSRTHHGLKWQQSREHDGGELLAMVARGEIDYTVADSRMLAIHQRYHPELRAAFDIGPAQDVAWALPRQPDSQLYSQLLDFWHQAREKSLFSRLEERYFGHIEGFDYVDTRAFIRATKSRLPKYQSLFERYAGPLDWRKLAAVSYQESHWKPEAVSPTGVRGLMMLTRDTAKRMGIADRVDPEQSIQGGSGYLQQLMTRLPAGIPDSERIWFAMAAYNIGIGHLEDARVLTQKLGKDPNNWLDVKHHLPLLKQKRFYQHTKYGRARGDVAAHYVDNIRRYYDTLVWLDTQARLGASEAPAVAVRASSQISKPSVAVLSEVTTTLPQQP